MKRAVRCIALVALVAAGTVPVVSAQSRYAACQREASEISGYRGQEAEGLLSGTLRGGLGGAALGAAGGWVTDSDAKKTARRGAALGALIGGVRAASKKRKLDDKRETYDRALQSCMERER